MDFVFNLVESIPKFKIFRKILRFLPEKFHAKITVIEEVKDIDHIPLTELIGNLQTYEMGLGLMGKGERSNNLAFKGVEEESDDPEDEDEDEDLTFITDEIIKLLQFRKEDKDQPPRKFKSSRKGKNDKIPYPVP